MPVWPSVTWASSSPGPRPRPPGEADRLSAPPRGSGLWLDAGVALAAALAVALWDTRWRVVPAENGEWRGLTDPPTAARVGIALLAGFVCAAVFSRAPRSVRRPVLALLLVALPALPVLAGIGLPLLAFQGPVLVLVVSAVAR